MSTVDFGTDVAGLYDTDAAFSTVSGIANLGRALGRRYITPRGTLDKDDPEYGTDLRRYMNADVTSASVAAALRADATAEALKEKKILSVDVQTFFESRTNTLTLTVVGSTAAGPFRFVFALSPSAADLIEAKGA